MASFVALFVADPSGSYPDVADMSRVQQANYPGEAPLNNNTAIPQGT